MEWELSYKPSRIDLNTINMLHRDCFPAWLYDAGCTVGIMAWLSRCLLSTHYPCKQEHYMCGTYILYIDTQHVNVRVTITEIRHDLL